jgi:hypothetical protein
LPTLTQTSKSRLGQKGKKGEKLEKQRNCPTGPKGWNNTLYGKDSFVKTMKLIIYYNSYSICSLRVILVFVVGLKKSITKVISFASIKL